MAIKKKELTQLLLDTTLQANRDYERISGGAWLHEYGVESYLSAKLADAIHAKLITWYKTGCVTLEEPTWAFDEYGVKEKTRGKKPAGMRHDGRVDIALWKEGKGHGEENFCLIGAIEVKRKWDTAEIRKDLDRLYHLNKRCRKEGKGSLEYTAYVSFLHTEDDDTDGSKMKKLHGRIKDWLAENDKFGTYKLSFAPISYEGTFDGELYLGSAMVVELV